MSFERSVRSSRFLVIKETLSEYRHVIRSEASAVKVDQKSSSKNSADGYRCEALKSTRDDTVAIRNRCWMLITEPIGHEDVGVCGTSCYGIGSLFNCRHAAC